MRRLSSTSALLIMLVLLAMIVAACGGGSRQQQQGSSTGSSGQGSASASGGSANAGTPAVLPQTGATPAGSSTAGTGGTPSAGGASGTTMTLPANCSNVQLTYWTPFTGPDGPFMSGLIDQFNKANPQIKATVTAQAEYPTKLSTAAASDSLPDLAVINEDQVATQAFNHVIRPMDQIVGQIGVSASDFPAASWAMGQVAGKTYAIPLSIVPMTMYYNADLLSKAGISAPPKNADEFAKAAQAMTQGNTKGFMITTGFPNQQIFQQLLHQFGGTEFNPGTTQATWNSDAGVKALQWMKDAQSKYSAPKLPVDADLNGFKAGQAGIIFNGIWQLSNVTGNAVDFKSGATAMPQIGSQPATWAGEALLGLPVHKRGEDACKTTAAGMLIKYLLQNSVQWSKAGNIPAYNTARHSQELQALSPQNAIAPSVENPTFLPAGVPSIADAFAPLGDAVGAVLAGTTTDIKGALDSSANRADQILQQNKQKYGSQP
jgi:multiple sugar transport system substrate-binding protein